QNDKGNIELRADIEKDTIWATQAQIGDLFEVGIPTINEHLKNIFKTNELNDASVIRNFRITAADGKKYLTKLYNLDAIIAVGYRVNSKKATQFRIWATGVLREYLKQGYALDRDKLEKTPEAVEGLDETLALMSSPKYRGKLKGKLVFKLTKNMEPKK
ncbi:MAG: virulence RhuM family protein, partial [Patescibacteria group bacterium]|nr:virulence RhuM family protein [Patescibacteria group bacterium]